LLGIDGHPGKSLCKNKLSRGKENENEIEVEVEKESKIEIEVLCHSVF
jgi:hypothetical protein